MPTIAGQGYPDYDYVTFYGLSAPKGTPPGIVNRLNEEINRALQLPEVRQGLEPTGAILAGGTTAEFATSLARSPADPLGTGRPNRRGQACERRREVIGGRVIDSAP